MIIKTETTVSSISNKVWQLHLVHGVPRHFSGITHRLHGTTVFKVSPVAEFIDPRPGTKVNSGIGLLCRLVSAHVAWRAGTTTLCRS